MKKILFLMSLFVFIFLSGCSYYGTNWKVDHVSSPDATTQLLRNVPLAESVKNVIFFNKSNIKDLCGFMKSKSELMKYYEFEVISNKTAEVSVRTDTINNFLNEYQNILNGKIFIDIQYSQISLTENQLYVPVSTEYEQRLNLFKNLLQDELSINGFIFTNDIVEADYKIKIIVLEDGITVKNQISLLYSKSRKIGIVGYDVKFINLTNNNIAFAYNVKNRSYFTRTNILYFIPIYKSSENLNMQY